jgi:GNAT superfamily N-acetyltransferase
MNLKFEFREFTEELRGELLKKEFYNRTGVNYSVLHADFAPYVPEIEVQFYVDRPAEVYVAIEDGELVGWCYILQGELVTKLGGTNKFCKLSTFVAREHRNKGIGTELMIGTFKRFEAQISELQRPIVQKLRDEDFVLSRVLKKTLSY